MNYKKGDKVKGQIKSITDFGVFIGLPGNIDGLVHLSDLSWSAPGEEAVRNYKKGDETEAWCCRSTSSASAFRSASSSSTAIRSPASCRRNDKNSIVKGTVKSIDAKGAVIALEGDVEGYLRASEVARDRVEDIRTHLKEGDAVNAMIINIDRKNRTINLSIKAKDMADESDGDAENRGRQAAPMPAPPISAHCSKPSWTRPTPTNKGDAAHDEVRADREAGGALSRSWWRKTPSLRLR